MTAAALVAAACHHQAPGPMPSHRDAVLDRAFSLTAADPGLAARLFAEAGEGPVLEAARMESWLDCLARTSAASSAWRHYLAAFPPPKLEAKARLHLVRALIAEGDVPAAAAERAPLSGEAGSAADESLALANDSELSLAAARRLAVAAPRVLSRLDKDLARRLLSKLGPEERLQRARAWRREGRPARAASELRSQRWKAQLEIERRRELARAHIDAGSPLAALRALPGGRDAGAPDLELRARASRNRAWGLWPKSRSQSAFKDCLTSAERALAGETDSETRRKALTLRLECATEIGRLETAFTSWRLLEEEGWKDRRREWLGRRLGLALAVDDDEKDRSLDIARALPSQARCLRFWTASRAATRDVQLESLADVSVPDLYATWSLETLGRAAALTGVSAPAALPVAPPESVQRLLDAGADKLAAREWRRIRRARRPTPGEAFTAARLSAGKGLANDAIYWLRAGFPELGTVETTRAPKNVVEAYLPLRWRDTLFAVAAEFNLDPWLIAGVARQESTFTAHAVSPRGAIGVLQLLPSTARGHARALGMGGTPDLRDAEINLRLGARELAHLLRRFGAVEPALAAYNGGETRIRGWWKRQPDRRRFTEEIPIPETYSYVRRVIYLREAYRQAYAQTQGAPQ